MMKQYGFYFDQTRCTGCYTCAVACKDWHDIEAGPVSWMRIKTIEEGKFPDLFAACLATPCWHCENPPCVTACPADAITKRESDGIVTVEQEKCLGNEKCNTRCLNACPWNAPQFGPEKGARMQKCDFCLERLEDGRQTICVEACPMFALDAGPVEELQKKYGNKTGAAGFTFSKRFKPSVMFTPKSKNAHPD